MSAQNNKMQQVWCLSQNYGLKGFRDNFGAGLQGIPLTKPWDPGIPKGINKVLEVGDALKFCVGSGNARSQTQVPCFLSAVLSAAHDSQTQSKPPQSPLTGRDTTHHYPIAGLLESAWDPTSHLRRKGAGRSPSSGHPRVNIWNPPGSRYLG